MEPKEILVKFRISVSALSFYYIENISISDRTIAAALNIVFRKFNPSAPGFH